MTWLHKCIIKIKFQQRYDIYINTREIYESRTVYGYKKNYIDNYIDAHTT